LRRSAVFHTSSFQHQNLSWGKFRGHRRHALTAPLSTKVTKVVQYRRTSSCHPQRRHPRPSTALPPGANGIRRRAHPKRIHFSTTLRKTTTGQNLHTIGSSRAATLQRLTAPPVPCLDSGFWGPRHILTGVAPLGAPLGLTVPVECHGIFPIVEYQIPPHTVNDILTPDGEWSNYRSAEEDLVTCAGLLQHMLDATGRSLSTQRKSSSTTSTPQTLY
jgi:hypothetical protein